jgi:hypothetical protein
MTEKHKNAIRRGIKRMQRRRNLSAGMKASWARRRALAGDNPPIKPNSTLAVNAAVDIACDELYSATITLLGIERTKRVLSNAIKESL